MVRFGWMPPWSRVPSERGTLFSSTVTVIGTSDGERPVSCPIFHGFVVQYDNCKGRLLYRDLNEWKVKDFLLLDIFRDFTQPENLSRLVTSQGLSHSLRIYSVPN
ncbi:hypothetical protein CEXT_12041 [Caerostris extrusa]|uniref:Uncharacterized protein n=1 Tax=Caerostris extrusa TaxID=172846 RepID=A0AAV4Y872_CAEEX|nr:hypothetical protein CEXT_12041 [Caerostris extrusa]